MRTSLTAAFAVVILLGCTFARGAGFAAELKVTDGKATRSARTKPPVAADQMIHRATLETSADAHLTATWKVVRTDPAEVKDALVHFVVVKLDRPGQAIPALEPDKVTIECALTMDFAKDKTASGSQPFRIQSPGVYLVRIEAGGDPDKPGQEDFGELELIVK
jgi:hypothetical protein